MEHISNKEKAIEIANKEKKYYGNPQYEKRDENWSVHECFKSAIQAMQWKDEQHEKEKQQWIDKAVEWIKDQLCYYAHIETNSDTFEKEIEFDEFKMANDFKQSVKGE